MLRFFTNWIIIGVIVTIVEELIIYVHDEGELWNERSKKLSGKTMAYKIGFVLAVIVFGIFTWPSSIVSIIEGAIEGFEKWKTKDG